MNNCPRCKNPRKGKVVAEYYNNIGNEIERMWTLNISLGKEQLEKLCNNCAILVNNLFQAYYNYQVAMGSGGAKNKYERNRSRQMLKVWEGNQIWEFNPEKQSFEEIWEKIWVVN